MRKACDADDCDVLDGVLEDVELDVGSWTGIKMPCVASAACCRNTVESDDDDDVVVVVVFRSRF